MEKLIGCFGILCNDYWKNWGKDSREEKNQGETI
jgi:hypothetical protein